MHTSINIASDPYSLAPFATAAELNAFLERYRCDGVELILCGPPPFAVLPPALVRGLHLIYYPGWMDLWQGNFAALDREFGSREVWMQFYQAAGPEGLLANLRRELDIAQELQAEYVVFHMADNCLREYFTLQFARSDQEIIDASAELINCLFDGQPYQFALLLENLWGNGMTLTRPDMVRRVLSKIHYTHTGLMLDTGHLMATNPSLRTQEQGIGYIHQMLDGLGPEMEERILGMHLHQSLAGEYLLRTAAQPPTLEQDYYKRYAQAYRHMRQVDQHAPFSHPETAGLIQRIRPQWLTHELARDSMSQWETALAVQAQAIQPPAAGLQKENTAK